MDVFDLQGKLSIDTTPYLEALRRAAQETERLRTQMSAPLATPTVPGTPTTPGSSPSTPGSSPLAPVVSDAEKAGQAIDDLNKKLGEGFATAAKVGAAAWATFSAAAVAATKKAVDGYAQYEQLVGGVETLFKDSADTVQQYAENAYKTAGMSANQYMQTVTAFSASLISSLEGDTAAAAEKANTAITDMADNSNKMGTSLESLTRAYMGFSRQNFTMLDNLALGFAGTKEGMQQLLDKAEELSGIKYNITQYSDIVDAIHVVQQEMGITGTTAKEAADTIEGSMNSTKAALDNLLVGFARGDADIDKLMGDVDTNIRNLANNAIPVAERAFVNLTKYAIQAGMEIAEELPKLIRKATEDIHKMIASTFGEGANTIFGIEAALKAAAAAFVAFKAAAYVADVVDKIKALNTALQGTVTLSEAMKAANLANPWVLAATAIAAATVAAKSWIDAQTDAMQEAVNGYDLLDDAQKQVYDSINDVGKAVYDTNSKWSTNSESIEENAAKCAGLANQLYALNEQEELSNEDKAKMQAIVDVLNSSIEGLNVTIDKQTGRLKGQKKAIDDIIRSYREQAKAAAAQERLKDLYSEQWKAEKNLKDITEKRAEARRRVNEIEAQIINKQKERIRLEKQLQDTNDIGGKITDSLAQTDREIESLNGQLKTAKENVGDLDGAFVKSKETLRSIDTGMEEATNMLGEVAAAAIKTAATFEKSNDDVGESAKKLSGVVIDAETEQVKVYGTLNEKTYEWSEEQIRHVAAVIDEYIAYRAEVEKSIKGSVDIFGEFEQAAAVDLNKIMANMKSNTDGVREWTENIKKLRKDGVLPDEMIDQWENMGIASQGYVKALAEAAPEIQQQFADTWRATQQTLDAAVHQAVKDDKKERDALLEDYTQVTGVKLGELKKNLDGFITAESETYVKGIDNAVKAAKEAAKSVGDALNGVDSEDAGKSVMERFADSLTENAKPIIEWARNFKGVMTGDTSAKIEGGKINFPSSSVSGENSLVINFTAEIDGESLCKKTVKYNDALQGKRADAATRGLTL